MIVQYIINDWQYHNFEIDPGCFPSMAKVMLESGISVTMLELKIGDKVQTGICIKNLKSRRL